MSERFKFWALCLASLVLAQSAASFVLPPRGFALAAISDLVQCVLLMAATGLCCLTAAKASRRAKAFWALMSAGLGAWLAYQVLWTYIEVLQHHEVPNLFTGDAILFLHFVPMMAALALQPHVDQDHRELRLGSLDFALLLLWWIFLYLYSVIPWQYVYPNESAYNYNLNYAYLFEKGAFLLGVALLWYRSSGLWKKIFQHWFLASALYSCSSYVANWALGHDRYYSGSLYDLPLIASMAWMAVPPLLALQAETQQQKPATRLVRGLWTARLGMLAVFSLPFFAWLAFFHRAAPPEVRNFRLGLSLIAIIFMGGLIFLKQHLLDIELIRLLRSSRQAFDDLQLLQAQLVQSEKLASLGHLVGGAAHELNNPLTAMLGYSELLGSTELSTEQRALSEKISTQAKRIRSLVASLLSFAKQAPGSKSSLDINVVVQTALKLGQAELQSAGIQYSTELAETLPLVTGDSNQLLKVFSHIIHNATHAMAARPHSTLTVRTFTHDETVAVQFSDNGPGISEPARVFDPFYTTRPVGQGTGLGLSMCYGIVQEHGGKISCRNHEAGGAIFLVELPAVTTQALRVQAHAVKL